MKRTLARSLLSLIAVGTLATAVRADDWTSPKEVAKAAHDFSGASQTLQQAIKDVDEESELVAEIGSLSKSAAELHKSVSKGAAYEDAKKDFRKIESGYARFEAKLKKAHDIHHEKPVADAAKKVKSTFDQLKAHISGRRPSEKTDQASPTPPFGRTTDEDSP
ncbi:MAG: hypothetical protein NVSMB14_12530 [Isosphaeraceae bacterium]